MAKQTWEYKVISQMADKTYVEKMLNEQGAQGWELVGTERDGLGHPLWIFKRPA